MTGFIAMTRGWQEHRIFAGDEFSRRDAWAWLIDNAAWKPKRVRTYHGPVFLQRGQLCFSVRFMAEKWGWSKSRVDRFLHVLNAEGMIASTRSHRGTVAGQSPSHLAGQPAGQSENVITICNYDKFQSVTAGRRDSPQDSERDSHVTESGTKNNHITNKPDSPPTPSRGKTSLPSDWKPPPLADLSPVAKAAASGWPPGMYEREAEKFETWAVSNGRMKTDWRAAWRNWISNANDRWQETRKRGVRAGTEETRPLWEQRRDERLSKEGRV